MCKNYHGETPFHIAAKENRLEIIKLYHEKYSDRNKFHVEHVANDGFNATLYACMNTNIAIIDYLINEMSASVNYYDKNQRLMIHWACRFGNIVLLKKLI